LSARAAPDRTADDLVARALSAGSADNCTVLVVDILDTPLARAEDISETFDNLPMPGLPQLGEVIDAFRLDAELSDGRYSRLIRAEDLRTGQKVVLKFPKPDVAEDEVYRRAFVNEAFVTSRVRSPWIGETIELPPEGQTRLYSVMPFYDGETLEHRLKRDPPIGLEEGALLATRMARAIVTLHRAGIIHRDIKPDNVMLLRDGGLKLLDLGVARLPQLEDFPEAHTPGTPSYMAPEIFDGARGDEGSDLFALGVTVYRLFTRAYPYGEIEPFTKPRFGKAGSFTARRPDLPAWLEGAITRAVAVDPARRHGDVLEFAFEIENAARRGGPAQRPKQSLYDKNPLLFWQAVSALLVVLLAVALAR
jgi:serine/threonine protein kinase